MQKQDCLECSSLLLTYSFHTVTRVEYYRWENNIEKDFRIKHNLIHRMKRSEYDGHDKPFLLRVISHLVDTALEMCTDTRQMHFDH